MVPYSAICVQQFDQEWSDATEIRSILRINMLQRKTIASTEVYKIATRNTKKISGKKREL